MNETIDRSPVPMDVAAVDGSETKNRKNRQHRGSSAPRRLLRGRRRISLGNFSELFFVVVGKLRDAGDPAHVEELLAVRRFAGAEQAGAEAGQRRRVDGRI